LFAWLTIFAFSPQKARRKARISRETLAGSKRTGFASKIRHARVTMKEQVRTGPPGYIAFAIQRRNKALTAFVCHTLSSL
jgi:hypothetical protein